MPYTWWQVLLLLPHWLHGTAYWQTFVMTQHSVFLKTNLRCFCLGLHFKDYFLFNNVFNIHIFILLSAIDQHNYVNSPI